MQVCASPRDRENTRETIASSHHAYKVSLEQQILLEHSKLRTGLGNLQDESRFQQVQIEDISSKVTGVHEAVVNLMATLPVKGDLLKWFSDLELRLTTRLDESWVHSLATHHANLSSYLKGVIETHHGNLSADLQSAVEHLRIESCAETLRAAADLKNSKPAPEAELLQQHSMGSKHTKEATRVSIDEIVLKTTLREESDRLDTNGNGLSHEEAAEVVNMLEEEGKGKLRSSNSLGDVKPNSTENLAQRVQQKRNQLMSAHGTPQLWSEFEEEATTYDHGNTYQSVLDKRLRGEGFWHWTLRCCGHPNLLPTQAPKNMLAQAASSRVFTIFQTFLILSNTAFIGYEADVAVRALLKEPPEKEEEWTHTVMTVYSIIFMIELAFRLIALRGWFWVSGNDWLWNTFDFVVVTITLISDENLSFMRMLRILRVVRVARVIRVLRVFRQLRQMLFSILACLGSLVWAFVFLVVVMFMFSVFFLQGVANTVTDLDLTTESGQNTHADIREWFGSLDVAMLSLLAAVTGGIDWLTIKRALDHLGGFYGDCFIAYLLFITVGVMNVLTGVFLNNATDFSDLDLMVQSQQVKVESFIDQMIQLYEQIDLDHTGVITWQSFHEALQHNHVRAFLASMDLDPTHVRLLFDLLDVKRTGQISMSDFVMSMLSLRGEAKAIDARIIQREISMIPLLLSREG